MNLFVARVSENHGIEPRDVRCFSKIIVLIMMEIGTA